MYFRVTIKYNGITENYVVFANDAAHCEFKLNERLKDAMYDYEITELRAWPRLGGVIE